MRLVGGPLRRNIEPVRGAMRHRLGMSPNLKGAYAHWGEGLSMAGWVYVIRNSSMPKLVKIDFTDVGAGVHGQHLMAREGVRDPYDVAFRLFVEHPREVQKQCHLLLRENRHRKEWFRCSVKRAAEAIQQAASNGSRRPGKPLSPSPMPRPSADQPSSE